MMNKELMTARILEAKVAKDMTWEAIAEAIGLSPVFTTSACLGMNSLTEDKAFALCEALGLDKPIAESLQICPKKAWEGG
ncbi:MAG: cyanate hydratase, partial [Marinobacter sp.]